MTITVELLDYDKLQKLFKKYHQMQLFVALVFLTVKYQYGCELRGLKQLEKQTRKLCNVYIISASLFSSPQSNFLKLHLFLRQA